jgi:pimeloyl-ACP methyl ester carboxylesterase
LIKVSGFYGSSFNFPMKFLGGFLALLFAGLTSAREAPRMVELSTRSVVATWSLTPALPTAARSTPVVFLHGGPGLYTEDRRIEQGQVFRTAGFTTIFYDQVGSGQSKQLVATDYSLNRMVDDLEALRVYLGSSKLILWGNSWGSQLAVLYARKFPDRVAALILTSPGIFPGLSVRRDYTFSKRGSIKISDALSNAVELIDDKGGKAETQISQTVSGRLFDELAATELLSAMVCRASNITNAVLPGGGNLFVNRIVQKEVSQTKGPWHELPKVPSLVVRGGCDFIPTASAERYAQLLNARFIELPNAGHALLEDPASIDQVISAFISNQLTDLP